MLLRSGFEYRFLVQRTCSVRQHRRNKRSVASGRKRKEARRSWRTAVGIPAITRFKIKERPASRVCWMQAWATHSMASRMVRVGELGASHLNPGVNYLVFEVKLLDERESRLRSDRIVGAGSPGNSSKHSLPSWCAFTGRGVKSYHSEILSRHCWCYLCIPKPCWSCDVCSRLGYQHPRDYDATDARWSVTRHFSSFGCRFATYKRYCEEKLRKRLAAECAQ